MASLGRLSLFSKAAFTSSRCLSQSSTLSAKPSKAKQKRILEKCNTFLNRKITSKNQNKKTEWYNTPMGISSAGQFGVKKGPSAGSLRRAHQLSVVLSQYVIGLINSGELDPRLPDLGVDIIRVKLVPDMGALHVYWMASGTSDDAKIQEILQEVCYTLRSMLTGLHVMNYLPPVVFIKDVSTARLQEVETLLEQADMGPDHEPSELGADMKSDISLPYYHATMTPRIFQDQMEAIGEKLINMDFRPVEEVVGVTQQKDIATSPALRSKEVSLNGNDNRNNNDIKSKELDDFENNLRSDIYDVDHSALTQKVLQIKQRRRMRGFQIAPDDENLVQFNPDQKVMADLSKEDIQKFLAARKRTMKRESSMDYLDSRLYRGGDEVDYYNEEHSEEDLDVNYDDDYNA